MAVENWEREKGGGSVGGGGGAGEYGKIERGEDLGPSAVGVMLCWPVVVEDFSYHFQERAPGFCLEGVQRCISLIPRPGGGP